MKTQQLLLRTSMLIIYFSFMGDISAGSPKICYEPNCGSNDIPSGQYSARIERTFLKKFNNQNPKINSQKHVTKKRKPKGRSNKMMNPLLELSIDSSEIMNLFAITNKRIYTETAYDTLNTITMDVGLASADTQYWAMPDLPFIFSSGMESIDPIDSPFSGDYPSSNLVFQSSQSDSADHDFIHYEVEDDVLTQLGLGIENEGDPFIMDYFETEAFLPIEFGWEIEETVTTYWPFDPDVDSSVLNKVVVLDGTGRLTPINEEPVDAIISFVTTDWEVFKDGIKIDSGFADSFVWFSTEGHWLVGYLEPHAETEGPTQFVKFTYQKNIPACPPAHDLGLDLFADNYKAQKEIVSGAQLTQGPVNFIASQSIGLKTGFSTDTLFTAIIDMNPCTFE